MSSDDEPATKRLKTGENQAGKEHPTVEEILDKENPFAEAFCDSDVVLVVEGRKLHAHKVTLSLACTYFRVLFDSKNFAESGASEFELEGDEFVEVTYDSMVNFLSHIYPVVPTPSIEDDDTLSDLLPLADYFQCRVLRHRCVEYIDENADEKKAQTVVLYLHLCEKYNIPNFNKRLLWSASYCRVKDIEACEQYKHLPVKMQRDIFRKRASRFDTC